MKNMREAWHLIKTDYLRYSPKKYENIRFRDLLLCFSTSNAFRLSCLYRLSVPIYFRLRPKKFFWIIPSFLFELTRFLTGSEIDPRAEIGEGLKIIHGVGIIIGIEVKIGKNAYVYNDITIGYKNIDDEGTGQAKIGDNVRIGTGARLLGNITLGNNVVIGANAVVTRSFPDNVVLGGVPAKIIKYIDA